MIPPTAGETSLATCEALAGSHRFRLTIPRRRNRDEIVEQMARDVRDLLDGQLEGRLVSLRRFRRAADLADELERGRVHLVLARGRLEVVERSDVSAHRASVAVSHLSDERESPSHGNTAIPGRPHAGQFVCSEA